MKMNDHIKYNTLESKKLYGPYATSKLSSNIDVRRRTNNSTTQ